MSCQRPAQILLLQRGPTCSERLSEGPRSSDAEVPTLSLQSSELPEDGVCVYLTDQYLQRHTEVTEVSAGMPGKLKMSRPPAEVTCSHPVAAQWRFSGPWMLSAVYT